MKNMLARLILKSPWHVRLADEIECRLLDCAVEIGIEEPAISTVKLDIKSQVYWEVFADLWLGLREVNGFIILRQLHIGR